MEKWELEKRKNQIETYLQKIKSELSLVEFKLSEVNYEIHSNIMAYRSEFAWVPSAAKREYLCFHMAKRRELRQERRRLRKHLLELKEELRNLPA